MHFRILGPLEVYDGEQVIDLGRPQQRGVLAILLLHANEVVPRDRLIDDLWGTEAPSSAANTLQVYVSHLRKALGAELIVTRSPGYMLQVGESELDLYEFEGLLERGRRQLEEGDAEEASTTMSEALSLWKGPALADFAYDAFAQGAIARLEELRLVALELRADAELASGRHSELVGELEELVADHPLRERLRAQLMLALYRSGRQADALDAYRDARNALVSELGIEPSQSLRRMEQAILRQDTALDLEHRPTPQAPSADSRAGGLAEPERAILVLAETIDGLDALLPFVEPLAEEQAHELILARLVSEQTELAETMEALDERRKRLAARQRPARITTFTSPKLAEDVVRLAAWQDVDLLVTEAPVELYEQGVVRGEIASILADAPSDVALAVHRLGRISVDRDRPVVVPFGGDENEWAAVELGAWIAKKQSAQLCLIGSTGDPDGGERDASRLLGSASLIVQKSAGVVATPQLVSPGAQGVIDATRQAGLLVLALPDGWQHRGLGPVRVAISQGSGAPVLLVRKGLRPSGLAGGENLTRFTWTLSEVRA